jgi:hypothetical protein
MIYFSRYRSRRNSKFSLTAVRGNIALQHNRQSIVPACQHK